MIFSTSLFFFLFCRETIAHPLDLGLLQLDINGSNTISASLDLNATLVAQLLENPAFESGDLSSANERLFQLALSSSTLEFDATPCKWKGSQIQRLGQSIRSQATAVCQKPPQGELLLKIPFIHQQKLPRTFQILLKLNVGEDQQLLTLKDGVDFLKVPIKAQEKHFGDFVYMGIVHIGATPSEWHDALGFHLADGIDHILFLLALLLVGGSFLELLKTATGFTVGHSITLALAALNIIRLPSRFTESVIALSIAYVAIETLVVKKPRHRWKLAAGFGLIHGFGFASALGELQLSGKSLIGALIGFNAGVEVGQIIIMLFVFPCLLLLEKTPNIKSKFTQICSVGIGLIAIYWFFQRALAGLI